MEQVSLERFDLESLGSFLTFDLNGFGGAGFGRGGGTAKHASQTQRTG